MPMTRIEPYRQPRPTIRELMEGRPARAVDRGVPPKGYLGSPPRSAYRTEDRVEAKGRVRAREILTRFRGGPGDGTLRWTRASEQAGKALRSQGHHCAHVM